MSPKTVSYLKQLGLVMRALGRCVSADKESIKCSELLVRGGIEDINIARLVRFVDDSKLSRKVG
jgi:hypothetical protein